MKTHHLIELFVHDTEILDAVGAVENTKKVFFMIMWKVLKLIFTEFEVLGLKFKTDLTF